MAPVIKELHKRPDVACRMCVTVQHRQMLDQELRLFEIEPDYSSASLRTGKAERLFGFRAKTPFEEGMRRTIVW